MLNIKVYNRGFTTLKETIEGSLIIGDISFTSNINGGQGQVTLQLNKPITSTDYDLGDIIKIEKFDDNNKTGVDLYMGYVSKIGRKQTTTKEYIELSCLGLASIFTEQKVNKAFLNKPLGQLFREIIDDVNAAYGDVFNYTLLTIPDYGLLGTGQVGTSSIAQAFNILAQSGGGKYRYVDGNGTVYLQPKPSTPTHYLTNQYDVEDIDIQEEIQQMVNSVLFYNKSDLSESYAYSDPTSIAAYGTKFFLGYVYADGNALVNYATQYVNDRKDPKKQTTLVINRKYAIETIQPGDTVKVRNFEYAFNNIQVIKTQYTQDKVVLYLDTYVSFGDQLEKIQ